METTNTNVAPYYDDFDQTKKFHRILFRPRTVQTRELTQSQTILQNQIERLGNHLFKEGAMVIPGGFTIANKDISIGFTARSGTSLDTIQTALNEGTLSVSTRTSGIRFRADDYIAATDTDDTRIMGTYINPGNDNTRQPVINGEEIVFIQTTEFSGDVEIGYGVVTSSGQGTIAKVNNGVYYVHGFFIEVDQQTHVVSKLSSTATARVGFSVNESIVTSDDDASLLSNAAGELNERAPGADRLKIELVLTSIPLDNDTSNFVELARVEAGVIVTPREETQYSLLEDTLAQRTFEESGNYSVSAHAIEIREHLRQNNNEGFYTAENGGDESKLAVILKPGISYVRGYRVSNDLDAIISVDKGRDTAITNNAVSAGQYGGYLVAGRTTVTGVPLTDPNANWQLVNATDELQAVIRVIGVEYVGTEWRIYIRSVNNVGGGNITTATKIRCLDGGVPVFVADLNSKALVDLDKQTKIFRLPAAGIKTLSPLGSSDTTYSVVRDFRMSVDADGNGTVNAPSGSVFDPNVSNFFISKTDGSEGKLEATISLTGTPVGASLAINVPGGASDTVRLVAPIIKLQPQARTKTLIQVSELVTMGTESEAASVASLGNTDGFDIISVIDTENNDLTSSFRMNNGQTDTEYGLASIESLIGAQSGIQLNVTYRYFQHGNGDYFTVDSYTSVEYPEIPVYTASDSTEYVLHDCIDFRRSVRGGVIDTGDIIRPNTTIRSDIEYYLGRVDTLYVSHDAGFAVARGISSNEPKRPDIPENAMRLYDLVIPAYTFIPENVLYFAQDNKRFTMRDIGRLETRIENLEEVTTLNALEQNALNAQVIDPVTGLNRFKNGVFADPMKDDRLIERANPELNLNLVIDHAQPREILNALEIGRSAGGVLMDGMAMPAYEIENSISQLIATEFINVNPYASFNWLGTATLNPSSDFWFDQVKAAPVITNKTVNNRPANLRAGYTTDYRTLDGWEATKASRNTSVQLNDGRIVERKNVIVRFTDSTQTIEGETRVINEEVIPYMREIAVEFKATGLRPNTRVYGWFNNVNVSTECQQSGRDKGATMTTDEFGEITGVFFVPNRDDLRFRTGDGTFALSDSPTYVEGLNVTTGTTAPFSSGGITQTTETDYLKVRTLGFTRRESISYRRWDPVCQSFVVPSNGGEFISGVEVFFQSKAASIPVTMEIRNMENGVPGQEVLGRKTIKPTEVNVSTTAELGTTFTFDYPVFLEGQKEYCFVVLANTQEYNVYFAKLGGSIIGGSGTTLSKQPNTGVMFVSANGSTWTPKQDSDMKYNLKRCRFTAGSSDILFKPTSTPQTRRLTPNAISVVSGEALLYVYEPVHGLRAGDTVTISGGVGGAGILADEVNAAHVVAEVVDANNFKLTTATTALNSQVLRVDAGADLAGRNSFSKLALRLNSLVVGSTAINWNVRYKRDSNRSFTSWIPMRQEEIIAFVEEGNYGAVDDIELRATLTSTTYQAPQIDTNGFISVLLNYDIDVALERFNYVSQDLFFSNPSTGFKIFTGVLLPVNSDLKLYVKFLRNGVNSNDVEWTEVQPDSPLVNDGSTVNEFTYSVDNAESFSGMKVKLGFKGERVNLPLLRDMRGMAIA